MRDNICTVFNALNLAIAVALAAVGAFKNLLFIFIILVNTVVGIVQKVKAKRQIERLTLLAQPTVTVLRGKTEQSVVPSAVQKGDLLGTEQRQRRLYRLRFAAGAAGGKRSDFNRRIGAGF